jgi:SAM-dependent methyltransferase
MKAEASAARKQFLEDYRRIRYAEGRGSDDSIYYQALPFQDVSGRNEAMWALRAKTYSYFERNILAPFEAENRRPLDILDLGAGNCWLSYRLSLRRHRPIALDIFADGRDGLGAARHYPHPPLTVEADFAQLPFRSSSFDLAIFNASFHYSTDYLRTLGEAQRCLRPSGVVVILDTPLYREREHGLRMVEEKHAQFLKQYGFRSDAIPSMEFLDLSTLETLQRELGIHWRMFKPWYGFSWHLRPIKARLKQKRPPSRFWILTGKFESL